MLLQHLHELRAHGEWADARLFQAARVADGDVSAVVRELAHIRGAQETWLARIEGRQSTAAVWPEWSLVELEQAGAIVGARLRDAFASLTPESLTRVVTYTSLAGQAFHTPVGEILLQVLTHGMYHRGKANAALRQAGGAPVGVDYILWQRETARARD